MGEINPWSRVTEDWEVMWVKPSSKDEFGDPPAPHTFIVTRSNSLQLLLRTTVSQQKMTRELLGLLQAINEGLLDDLEHDIPPDFRKLENLGY